MLIDISSWELTKELGDLSGWEPDASNKALQQVGFSAGYLLRKLPVVDENGNGLIGSKFSEIEYGYAYMSDEMTFTHKCTADTPEDALASLAILLINQGVLNPKGNA